MRLGGTSKICGFMNDQIQARGTCAAVQRGGWQRRRGPPRCFHSPSLERKVWQSRAEGVGREKGPVIRSRVASTYDIARHIAGKRIGECTEGRGESRVDVSSRDVNKGMGDPCGDQGAAWPIWNLGILRHGRSIDVESAVHCTGEESARFTSSSRGHGGRRPCA